MPPKLPDILRIDWPAAQAEPDPETDRALDRAAAVLKRGGLVAIPTETVYGLAADALDEDAVAGIFRAKGRPASNPLIVHVSDIAMARTIAAAWPAAAAMVTESFWPGPVTIVVPRGPRVPDVVTAGGPTVAIRCPDHRLTRRLIDRAGVPLAAPSANRSEALSPTTAQHVLEGLGNRVELILDGGPCGRGLESTVVDCTLCPPRILRPGPVTRTQLEAALGGPVAWLENGTGAAPARSPGMQSRHYAPRTPLELHAAAGSRVAELLAAGRRVGWLTQATDDAEVRRLAASRDVVVVPMPADPERFAAMLYATLHALDHRGLDAVIVDMPPDTDVWRAVHDRLTRAATMR